MARWLLVGLLVLAVAGVAAVGPGLEPPAVDAPIAATGQSGQSDGAAGSAANESPANTSAGGESPLSPEIRFRETADSVGFAFRATPR